MEAAPVGAARLRRPTVHLVLFLALWWVLAGGDARSWIIGLPTAVLAALVFGRLGPRAGWRLSPLGLLRFAPFFLRESILGGVDVAARTLSPSVRVTPGFVVYRTRLAETGPRTFFANCVSLLPGTLAADLDGDRVQVHALARDLDVDTGLRRLERAVAGLFGQKLETDHE